MRFYLFSFFIVVTVHAQVSNFDYERELSDADPVQFREKIGQLIRNSPGTAEAIYFGALIEPNAEKSVEAYKKVVSDFPKTDYAARALYKLGQYDYSRGLYVSARENFLKLTKDYPQSPLSEKADYFAASCLCASKKLEECSDELKDFIKKYRDSELSNLAQIDYEELKPLRQQLEITNQELKFDEDAKFTLQMGVFTKPNNALNYRNFFTRINLPAVIRERKMGAKSIYFVLLGSFQSYDAADQVGKKLQKQHGKPYRVVEIK